ncbi:hypothetical protein GGX14DRAFT_157176 [Mycena pura]|uniref:MYND-type domain-containing protein n=1 Tax=Mycena pura TaxID=153505 RepID=A0AAD6V3Z9_9AGAR|nr:hypothetical protein GGX14DRAFT_157176 [Mycena pura]
MDNAMAAVLYPLPQDARRDPDQWNAAWELMDMGNDLDTSLFAYQMFVSNTCAIQRNITEEALRHFARDDFEAKWVGAGADVRGRHILGAMAAVCSKARNLNDARCYCPELRLMRLRLDGKVFLDLLKTVMHEDASFIPSQPIFVPHPGWDAWAAEQRKLNHSEAQKITLAEIMILRTKLICHVVQFTMRSFFGEDPPELIVQKNQEKPKLPTTPHPALAAVFGREIATARRQDDIAGIKALRAQRRNHCSYLACTKIEADDTKFSQCKPCFQKMQRRVLYCSVTCQRADWKLRHKAICGKPLDFETASQVIEHPATASTSHTRIGLPINGYKRSIALTAQVTALNRKPTVDYQLYKANNDPVDIDFGAGTYPQIRFRQARDTAMTTGDPNSVARIAHYLCACFLSGMVKDDSLRAIKPNSIVAQLAREFVLNDLRDLVLGMQRLQNKDPLRRPPLLSDAPPDLWASLDKDVSLSKVVVTLD